MNVGTKATARDEDNGAHSLRELIGELHADTSAEGMTHDVHLLYAQCIEEIPKCACVRTQTEVAVAPTRLAMANQVHANYALTSGC